MLKYVETIVTFSEVPDEISLCINISGCKIHCEDCHSPYLWEDKGLILNTRSLTALIEANIGITCVCFMGSGNSPKSINKLCAFIREEYPNLKTACYFGEDTLPTEIKLNNVDYFKIGHFNGVPLTNKNTNQRFYSVTKDSLGLSIVDITNKFYKHEIKN